MALAAKTVRYENGLRIGTRCETVDDFIDKFYRLCDGSMIFIPHAKRPIGSDTAFSFDLSDGRAALCGVGVVLDQLPDTSNRFGRPGLLLEVRQLQTDSHLVFEQMSTRQRAKRKDGSPTVPPSDASQTTRAPIPSHRPRAVTSAINIFSSVAIAEQASRSGGWLPTTRDSPAPLPPAPQVQSRAAGSTSPPPARPALPAPQATRPPRAVIPHEPAPHGTAPTPPAEPDADPVAALLAGYSGSVRQGFPLSPPEASAADHQPPPAEVSNVTWDPPAAASVAVATPTLRARTVSAARAVHERARTLLQRGRVRWTATHPRRRLLIAGAAVSTFVLMIMLMTCGSKQPKHPSAAKPVAPTAVATIGSASEPAPPAVDAGVAKPVAKKPVAKKPVTKKQPVASKRVATRKPTPKKKATKPTQSSTNRKHCSAQNCK